MVICKYVGLFVLEILTIKQMVILKTEHLICYFIKLIFTNILIKNY